MELSMPPPTKLTWQLVSALFWPVRTALSLPLEMTAETPAPTNERCALLTKWKRPATTAAYGDTEMVFPSPTPTIAYEESVMVLSVPAMMADADSVAAASTRFRMPAPMNALG